MFFLSDEPTYDPKLWFTVKYNCPGKHYIIGNPHTFKGRITGYCPTDNKYFNFSISDVTGMSVESKFWLKGYLAGNEPDPPLEEDDDVAYASEEHEIWLKEIELFHKTGSWYEGVRTCEVCGSRLLRSWIGLKCEKCATRSDNNDSCKKCHTRRFKAHDIFYGLKNCFRCFRR